MVVAAAVGEGEVAAAVAAGRADPGVLEVRPPRDRLEGQAARVVQAVLADPRPQAMQAAGMEQGRKRATASDMLPTMRQVTTTWRVRMAWVTAQTTHQVSAEWTSGRMSGRKSTRLPLVTASKLGCRPVARPWGEPPWQV